VLALAGAVLVACGQDVADIVIGRILTGSAFGLDFAVAIAMLAELTPARLRHRLNMWLWYLAVCGNLLLTLAADQWVADDSLWRYPVAATAAAALLLLNLQMLFLVESPCWLARQRRWQEAADAMGQLYHGHRFTVPDALHQPVAPTPSLLPAPAPDLARLMRRPYRLRMALAAAVQAGQAVQYFAVGWYLPLLSLDLFGDDPRQATWGTLLFNLAGLCGACWRPHWHGGWACGGRAPGASGRPAWYCWCWRARGRVWGLGKRCFCRRCSCCVMRPDRAAMARASRPCPFPANCGDAPMA
jgi:MFS family permease